MTWNHTSGRLVRLTLLTLRPTSTSLQARGARDERGATSWSREMDFNTPEDSDHRISYANTKVLKSISRLHDLAPCSSRAHRALNDAPVGRRVTGGRRLSRPDAWFHDKDVSYSQVVHVRAPSNGFTLLTRYSMSVRRSDGCLSTT